MKFEQNPLRKKKTKKFHQKVEILSVILKTLRHRKPDYELIQDISESDVCIKFE